MDAADVMVSLAPSLEDRAELDLLEEVLAAEGWRGAHFSDLVAEWMSSVSGLGDSEYTVEEYMNDLSVRDALELTLQRASERLGPRLAEILAPIDSAFLQITVEDLEGYLPSVFRLASDPGWWWSRVRAMPFG